MLWYLVVLVGGDREELGLWEDEGVLPSPPPQHVSGLDHMNPGLVAMQRVEDDLEIEEERFAQSPQVEGFCVVFVVSPQ